jgi:hypothetical protein
VKRGENVNVDEFTTAKSKQSKSATNSPAIAQTPTPKPIKSRTPTPKSTKSHKPPPKLLNYPEVLIHQQLLQQQHILKQQQQQQQLQQLLLRQQLMPIPNITKSLHLQNQSVLRPPLTPFILDYLTTSDKLPDLTISQAIELERLLVKHSDVPTPDQVRLKFQTIN